MFTPLNVISRLLLSKSAGPKVIIISGFYCIKWQSKGFNLCNYVAIYQPVQETRTCDDMNVL